MNYWEFLIILLPEAILTAFALLVIGLGVAGEQGRRRYSAGALTAVAAAGLVLAGVFLWMLPAEASIGGMLVIDPLAKLFKGIILFMTLMTLALVPDRMPKAHRGEYLGLVLLATTGLILVVGSADLLIVFISLELASLCLYILTGYDCDDPWSAEAAMKYFLFGSISGAFLLFGMSLVYGFTGATQLTEIGVVLASKPAEPILAAGVVMILAGLGFKVVAVPFHLWAPDAYQGAPAPSAALIAAGSKVAGFFILVKILLVGFSSWEGRAAWADFQPGWIPFLALLAALSMVVGNLAALAQKSVRRLLAYSAVAHAGYLLLGLLTATPGGATAVLFYVTLYGLTAIGAFGVVAVVEQRRGSANVEDFAGLSRESPTTAFCLTLFLISLAGIPPMAGFFGKFYLFTSALDVAGGSPAAPGLVWLVALALATNVLSLVYYLRVLKQVHARPGNTEIPVRPFPLLPRTMLCLLASLILVLGCMPDILLKPISNALRIWF